MVSGELECFVIDSRRSDAYIIHFDIKHLIFLALVPN